MRWLQSQQLLWLLHLWHLMWLQELQQQLRQTQRAQAHAHDAALLIASTGRACCRRLHALCRIVAQELHLLRAANVRALRAARSEGVAAGMVDARGYDMVLAPQVKERGAVRCVPLQREAPAAGCIAPCLRLHVRVLTGSVCCTHSLSQLQVVQCTQPRAASPHTAYTATAWLAGCRVQGSTTKLDGAKVVVFTKQELRSLDGAISASGGSPDEGEADEGEAEAALQQQLQRGGRKRRGQQQQVRPPRPPGGKRRTGGTAAAQRTLDAFLAKQQQ